MCLQPRYPGVPILAHELSQDNDGCTEMAVPFWAKHMPALLNKTKPTNQPNKNKANNKQKASPGVSQAPAEQLVEGNITVEDGH